MVIFNFFVAYSFLVLLFTVVDMKFARFEDKQCFKQEKLFLTIYNRMKHGKEILTNVKKLKSRFLMFLKICDAFLCIPSCF